MSVGDIFSSVGVWFNVSYLFIYCRLQYHFSFSLGSYLLSISFIFTVNLNVLITLLSCYTDLRVEREQKLTNGLL